MGMYYCCPSCGNREVGDSIYRCCNKTYCDSCVKGFMSNLIHSRCPECGGLAKSLGDIESRSSDDSSSDSVSDSDFDSDDDDDLADGGDIDSQLSRLMRYVRAKKDKIDSEYKAKFCELLLTLDWSEYPLAEEIYDELNS